MKRIVCIIIFFSLLWVNPAYSFWVWTPKTKKWVNPKNAVKPTPKEQFEFAKASYDGKKYEDANREFKKLLKTYPKSAEAADGQYFLGMIEEAQGNFYEAFLAFQKVIDKYPFSEKIGEIIERQYKIGEIFMSGSKRKTHTFALLVENPAIEIFTKVVENSTYGPLASKAQYKLGLVLKSLLRYYEAEEAFNKVVTSYPDSEWAQAARFQIASCRANVSRNSDYDQGATKEAKEKFEEFVRNNPDAALSREAESNISQLNEKEAKGNYDIGRFYEKQKAYDAAKVYYEETINNYPASIWSAQALDRLQVMEKLNEKKR